MKRQIQHTQIALQSKIAKPAREVLMARAPSVTVFRTTSDSGMLMSMEL